MDKDIIDSIRAVMKEELKPIIVDLEEIKEVIEELKPIINDLEEIKEELVIINKHIQYTWKDIGKFEKRIEKLEKGA